MDQSVLSLTDNAAAACRSVSSWGVEEAGGGVLNDAMDFS
jgi:hypothetical protein